MHVRRTDQVPLPTCIHSFVECGRTQVPHYPAKKLRKGPKLFEDFFWFFLGFFFVFVLLLGLDGREGRAVGREREGGGREGGRGREGEGGRGREKEGERDKKRGRQEEREGEEEGEVEGQGEGQATGDRESAGNQCFPEEKPSKT